MNPPRSERSAVFAPIWEHILKRFACHRPAAAEALRQGRAYFYPHVLLKTGTKRGFLRVVYRPGETHLRDIAHQHQALWGEIAAQTLKIPLKYQVLPLVAAERPEEETL